MAEQTISPAVFTNEYDQSYLPAGISAIGAAFIGPTLKGEAFVPTEVTSYTDYEQKFGIADGNSYIPYTVKSYMKYGNSATVTRILSPDGYTHSAVAGIILSSSQSGSKLIGVLHHTTAAPTANYSSSVMSTTSGSGNSKFLLAGGNFTAIPVTASFIYSDPTYIGKTFGVNPKTSDSAYFYTYFAKSAKDLYGTTATASLVISTNLVLPAEYSVAYTPTITSQLTNGTSKNLFTVKTLSQGEYNNTEFKISIVDIRKAGEVQGSDYGSFGLQIRSISDTDRNPNILESYSNLDLNPDSVNYICKKIGDKYNVYDTVSKQIIPNGDYDNISKYIRIEVADDVKNKSISPLLIPYGFTAIMQPLSLPGASMPTASMVTDQTYNSLYNSKIYYGFNFDFDNTDNKEYLKPIASGSSVGVNAAFNLDNYNVNAGASSGAGLSLSGSYSTLPLSARKFTVPFQGGFTGQDPAISKNMGDTIIESNTMGFDLQFATSTGSLAYQKAFDILSNTDLYDFNLLFTPGVVQSLHSSVVDNGISLCEGRGDAMYVYDNSPIVDTANQAIATVAPTDSSYAATYYPWLKIFDATNNKNMWIPPSVHMSGVFSFSDKVGYEWFAPAGFNRGVMSSVLDVYVPITKPGRDVLYEGRINTIAKFPKEGIVVMGQKTTQIKASALDRINVRRLLIKVKKYIASSSKYLLFEPNTDRTRTEFLNIVNPYLDDIKTKEGLYTFKVVCDETNNTPDKIDRNILYGQIWLQPTKTSEYIIIDFNVTPTGSSFAI